MAAYAALASLMNLIREARHHPAISAFFDEQPLEPITQHVAYFQNFLGCLPPAEYDDEVADCLEMRIARVSYEAEDAVESHIVEIMEQQKRNNNSENMARSINQCGDSLHRVVKVMDSIKEVVVQKMITEEKKKLVVRDQAQTRSFHGSVSSKERETTVAEFDAVSLKIMEMLTSGQPELLVIPIVGMGGIGKTFLARSVYASPLISDYFDICAWVTISQQYITGDILCELVSQTTKQSKELLRVKWERDLGSELHKYLFGRRFLIVLDDMWSIDAWENIQCFFPNNLNGSRILVTTRLSQLGSQLNYRHSHSMSLLDKASSWDLFSKTVFGGQSCPDELKDIAEKIVGQCRGLPLSISVVGGILKKMDANPAFWESIAENLSSVVNMDNDKHCFKLLKMSYNQLPVYLKPCFLYMGVFEEDHEIRVSTLVKLWVSEGFLQPRNGETLTTTARGFLNDLVDRNVILVGELGSTGSIKTCKIHDLVRDLCLKEGQKEGFYHVIGQGNSPPQGMNTQRRFIIPSNTSNEMVVNELRAMSQARSIICRYSTGTNLRAPPFRSTRFLRTLHEYHDECSLNSLAFGHFNLRHLTIKANKKSSYQLPSLVSHTWNLQTLRVDCQDAPAKLFSGFWRMPQFRHIKFIGGSFHLPDPPSDGEAVIMENLDTLYGVRNFKCTEGVVKRIPNIKKLGLEYDDDNDDDEYLVRNIQLLCRLESLFIQSCNVHSELTFPHSLKKLYFWMSGDFEWEDTMIEKIGSLPHLEKLKFFGVGFQNRKWEIVEGQFPSLKYLKLEQCVDLISWNAAEKESRILPCLERLHLVHLDELMEIPQELGCINTLKSIELFRCGEGAVMSAKEMVDEQVDSQGEELGFHVEVHLRAEDKHLASLAGPSFKVNDFL